MRTPLGLPRSVAYAAIASVLAVVLLVPGSGPATGASQYPDAPVAQTAANVAGTTNVLVSWTAATTGQAATSWMIQDWIGSTYETGATCVLCSSMVVPGLTVGTTYKFNVIPVDAAGQAPQQNWTNPITITSGCTGYAYCVTVDANNAVGRITEVGSGLGQGLIPPMPSALGGLAAESWRVDIGETSSGVFNYLPFDTARRSGAITTVLISDAWFGYSAPAGCSPSAACGAVPPWNNLARYANWVATYVRHIEASGRHPTYWEIQNEPDNEMYAGDYFSQNDAGSATIPNELAQFAAAYHAIKSVDASAKIIGPSISIFRAYPDGSGRLDMNSFLQFSAAHHLKWSTLVWHENGDVLSQDWLPWESNNIGPDMTTARRMLALYPAIGKPAVGLSEFSGVASQDIPGEMVGEFAAVESSGAAFADRSCFTNADDPSAGNACFSAPTTLDFLLTATGGPTGVYWAYHLYTLMAGQTAVQATPSDATFSALASRSASGAVTVLVGRHKTCTPWANPNCNQNLLTTPRPAATGVPVTFKMPWNGPAKIVISEVPDSLKEVGGPSVVSTQTVTVSGGIVTATIGSFQDGEAYSITVSHA